jgi:serine protease Do
MTVTDKVSKETVKGNIGDEDLSMADVVDLVSKSVVEITTSATLQNGLVYASGAGSGVIVNENGIIITNFHVVDGVTDIEVRLTNGNTYEASVVAVDSQTDLAVIKITPTEALTVAVCGNSRNIRVGEEVLAIGNPLGLLGGTVTNGIISALEREFSVENETMTLLQHNAAVSPGNSGGALFNLRGELIGIVNAGYDSATAQGLNFAIPGSQAIDIIEQIISNGFIEGRYDFGVEFGLYVPTTYWRSEYYVGITELEEFGMFIKNGFAIKAECRDCGQEFVIRHRDAARKMWNDGYFEEAKE